MASRLGPRSVKDATRFTSTIPHATSKSGSAVTPKAPRIPGETPEQRVRRLRQAHLAAQKAQISKTDRVIDVSRRFFDVAHRWTVGGIVIFTGMLTEEELDSLAVTYRHDSCCWCGFHLLGLGHAPI